MMIEKARLPPPVVAAQAQALVQDAHRANVARALAIHDQVCADRVGPMGGREIVASVPDQRVTADCQKRLVDRAAVNRLAVRVISFSASAV